MFMGFSSLPLWLPLCDNPKQIIHHHRSAQGWYGGTGIDPLQACFKEQYQQTHQSEHSIQWLLLPTKLTS
jgi:hypothetical protein